MPEEIIIFGSLDSEIGLSFSRSSGPGGQSVNKVNSKVELRFSINSSQLLTDEQKQIIFKKLGNKINSSGELIITNQSDRSQLSNRTNALNNFYELINKALKPRKKRKPTKPGVAAIERRLKKKREHSEKKSRRKE